MTKPPIHKLNQSEYVKSALRIPVELREELRQAAERNGRSMNAEIIARLQANPLDEIRKQNSEIKAMIREVLDKM